MSGTPTNFPYFGMPFVDLSNGHVTAPWTRFLVDLWTRTGGASGPGNTDLNTLELLLQDVDALPSTEAASGQLQLFGDDDATRQQQQSSTVFEGLFDNLDNFKPPPWSFSLLDDDPTPYPASSLGLVPSYFYPTWDGNIDVTVALAAVDRIYLYPFYVPENTRILSLLAQVVAGGAGSSAKAGIWSSKGGRPVGTPVVVDNTGAATTGAGIVTFAITPANIGKGWYWFGLKSTGTAPTYTHIAATSTRMAARAGASSAALAVPGGAGTQVEGFYYDDAYINNMPNLSGATLVTATGGTHGIPVGIVQLS